MATRDLYLKDERPPCTTPLFRKHWSERNAMTDRCKWKIVEANLEVDIIPAPARVEITIWMHHPVYDWDNVFVKPYIDALIGVWITDDDPRYLYQGSIKVEKVDKCPGILFEFHWEE